MISSFRPVEHSTKMTNRSVTCAAVLVSLFLFRFEVSSDDMFFVEYLSNVAFALCYSAGFEKLNLLYCKAS